MQRPATHEREYAVPTYRAAAGASWYHFLHGNVPGHQIDFIYRAEVPQGPLTPQHFSHLARLIKYIEPRAGSPCAFAIGNLSRDDTQHEPGYGGLALILGFRMKGATDHAGRRDPPFAHGIAAVDRHLDYSSIYEAAMAFCRKVLGEPEAEDSRALSEMYGRYVAAGGSGRAEVIRGYVGGFNGLPRLGRSRLSAKWLSRGAPPARRVVIVHADDAPFYLIAQCAARIAAVLYQSDVKWTAITTGRESEIPDGISVRFVPRRDAGNHEADALVLPIEQVPREEEEIAVRLFGAGPRDFERSGRSFGIRELLKAQLTSGAPAKAQSAPVGPAAAADLMVEGSSVLEAAAVDNRQGASGGLLEDPVEVDELLTELRRSRRNVWMRFGGVGLLGVAAVVLVLRGTGVAGEEASEPSSAPAGDVGTSLPKLAEGSPGAAHEVGSNAGQTKEEGLAEAPGAAASSESSPQSAKQETSGLLKNSSKPGPKWQKPGHPTGGAQPKRGSLDRNGVIGGTGALWQR